MNRADLEKKRQYWLGIVEDWHKSGENKAHFCRERHLRAWQFRYWHRRFRDDQTRSGNGFMRVHGLPEGSGLRLRTAGGLEIELDNNFEAQTLKRFLSVLASSC